MGEIINACRFSRPERKCPLERPRHILEDNIKSSKRNNLGVCGLD
jgi:hypothetical protein